MRIAVLGAGIIGLTAAQTLVERGHDVTVYASAFPPQTTSDRAAAIWWPDLAADPEYVTAEYRGRVATWARGSWRRYRQLAHDLGYGIRPERCVILSVEKPQAPLAAEIVEDSTVTHMPWLPGDLAWKWEFGSLLIEMPRFLPRLLDDYARRGGECVRMEFASWREVDELPAELVVNCTGLGSRRLMDDAALVPVRGQLILLRPQAIGYKLTAQWHGRSIYWMARSDALVLGGSYEVGEEPDGPTEGEIEAIWEAHCRWIEAGAAGLAAPVLRREEIIGCTAGLRPYRRAGVRLELDLSRGRPVIHNYGHGGCGVSLAWGCAEEVASIVDRLSPDVGGLDAMPRSQ